MIVAVITIIVPLLPLREDASPNEDNSLQTNINNYNNFNQGLPGKPTDDDIKKRAEKLKNVKPADTTPWPYAIVGTHGEGLKVRSGNGL